MTDPKKNTSTIKVRRPARHQVNKDDQFVHFLEISEIEKLILGAEDVTLGRGLDNTVILPFKDVSRLHARIYPKNDLFILEDCGSTNGVFVNGEQATVRALSPNDKIEIGSVIIFFRRDRKK